MRYLIFAISKRICIQSYKGKEAYLALGNSIIILFVTSLVTCSAKWEWRSATLSTHVTPGSQGVSMPSFMSIGPRMLVLEGNMHTDSRTDTVLLLLCTVKVTEWPGA